MTMASLQRTLQDLQQQETDLLESDPDTLEGLQDYWKVVRRTNLLLNAAGRSGLCRIGNQKIPPSAVTEKEAKDAIHMQMLVESLMRSPFASLGWSLSDVFPLLVNTPPEGLKKRPKRVYVTFNRDPNTENEYPYWERLYFHDPSSDTWCEAEGGADKTGLYYTGCDTTGKTYYTTWLREGRKHFPDGRLTWTLQFSSGSQAEAESEPEEDSEDDDLDGLPPPLLESTQVSPPSTPSPPDLSVYSLPGTSKDLRPPSAPKKPRSARQPSRPPPKRPSPPTKKTSERPTKRARTKPATSKGTGRQERLGLEPEEVGSKHQTVGRGGGHTVRQLLREAADPLGLCFEGKTGQLKTIRHRITHGPYRYQRISTAWHWINHDSPSTSKIIVTFHSESERQNFLDTFKIIGSGVRVFRCSLEGL